jgi:maltose O-acetyltransferase
MIPRLKAFLWQLRRALWHPRLVASIGSAGHGVRFVGRPDFTGRKAAVLEDNVHIGEGAFIRASGGLRIGANTHVSRNLLLYTVNHDFHGSALPYDNNQVPKPVTIGRNVWIGMNVCIAPGTTIGDGAIVGMGTVVSGDVPPLAIIASQPWRIVGERDPEHYRALDDGRRFGGADGRVLG